MLLILINFLNQKFMLYWEMFSEDSIKTKFDFFCDYKAQKQTFVEKYGVKNKLSKKNYKLVTKIGYTKIQTVFGGNMLR